MTVRLTPEDHVTFLKVTQGKGMRRVQIFGLCVALLFGGLLSWPAYKIDERYLQILYLAPIGLVGLAMFFSYGYAVRKVRREAARNPYMGMPLLYEIKDDGLSCENQFEQGVSRWKSFRQLFRRGSAFYLISTGGVHIFPDRSFATSEDSAIFFNQLLVHLETASKPA